MTKTICYISTIKAHTSNEDIDLLSENILQKNKHNNITGVLIVQNGHFFQIMEGEAIIVEDIYSKIRQDDRHIGIIKLLDKKIDYRMFEDYASGRFTIIDGFLKLKKLKIYFEWIKEANILAINELIHLTNNFLLHNK